MWEEFGECTDPDSMTIGRVKVVAQFMQGLLSVTKRAFPVWVVTAKHAVFISLRGQCSGRRPVVMLERCIDLLV